MEGTLCPPSAVRQTHLIVNLETRMRRTALTLALVGAAFATTAVAQDADRTVKDGGIKVANWKGRVDRRAASQGKTVADSKFLQEGSSFRLSVGPAGNFWNPANTANGNYEVMATFKEHKMASSHPHSYGMFIGGKDLESENETLMYCIVYGTGKYSIKTFHGAKVTTLVDQVEHAALKKADATTGESTNTIGWRVANGSASCVVNGQVVKTLTAAEYAGADKLTSTDGVFGLRVSHNLELTVSTIMKH
jgi:opacity protein-like surface antigen